MVKVNVKEPINGVSHGPATEEQAVTLLTLRQTRRGVVGLIEVLRKLQLEVRAIVDTGDIQRRSER